MKVLATHASAALYSLATMHLKIIDILEENGLRGSQGVLEHLNVHKFVIDGDVAVLVIDF